MKNERQKQNYEAMEPSKKRMLLAKKKKRSAGIIANRLELQKREQNNTKQSIQQRIKI